MAGPDRYVRDAIGRFASTPGGGSSTSPTPSARQAWEARMAAQDAAKAAKPIKLATDPSSRTEPAVRAVYGQDLGGGFHSVPDRVRDQSNGSKDFHISVTGKIIGPDGSQAGYFARSILKDRDGLYAFNDKLDVFPEHQGKGLAQRFNDAAEAELLTLGVTRVRLDAALSVGPYAWSRDKRMRFDESSIKGQGKDQAMRVKRRADELQQNGILTPDQAKRVRDEAIAVANAAGRGEDVRPYHIAAIGRSISWTDTKGNTMWPGKYHLLTETDANPNGWAGIKDITEAVTASASPELQGAWARRRAA